MSAANGASRDSRGWLRVVLWGLAYAVIGLVTAALSRDAGSSQMKQLWRLAAWLLSAIAFAAQIWVERARLGGSATRIALRAALAVALGGFVLAVSATVHSLSAGAGRLGSHLIALVAWPLLLFVPAFLVAWAVSAALAKAAARPPAP